MRSQLVLGKALMQTAGPDQACPPLERALALQRAVFDPDRSPDVTDAERTFADYRRASKC